MKAVIAIDSFKGSLSSLEAGNAVREGIQAVFPEADIFVSPLADGGEGTTEAIIRATGGELRTVTVSDPLGRKTEAVYGWIPQRKTAVIEMAAAAGLPLLNESERDPLYTTTFGVGEMISDAITLGCRELIIGIGGSATNDGGVGMLSALGFSFTDKEGNPIRQGAIGLSELVTIETKNKMPMLSECHFSVACDVNNPLCGDNGCSVIFSPQKGGTKETIPLMDAWLSRYAELTKEIFPEADAAQNGCGAAGGIGFAFLSYLNADLYGGIDLVLRTVGLERQIVDADVVITGEGRLDHQSCMGKAPVGVASLAKKYGKPVIAFSGCIGDGAKETHRHGIDAFFPIVQKPCTLTEAMEKEQAYRNLRNTAEEVFRLWKTVTYLYDSEQNTRL